MSLAAQRQMLSTRSTLRQSVPRATGLVRSRASCVAVSADAHAKVLLTREKGKNDKMLSALGELGMDCMELPLIQHSDGPDKAKLAPSIQEGYDWVALTSPEAAHVFLDAWAAVGKPKVRVAVVGAGTGEMLQQGGIIPSFTASKALGKTMGGELPKLPGGNNRVLFPASAKASNDLQAGLEAAGFSVVRLNTYNTSGIKDVPQDIMQRALACDIITFGSPSAVKAWVELVGLEAASKKLNVCIGTTSAHACDAAKLPSDRTYYPDSPGIDGWVQAVQQACADNKLPTK